MRTNDGQGTLNALVNVSFDLELKTAANFHLFLAITSVHRSSWNIKVSTFATAGKKKTLFQFGVVSAQTM